MSTSATLDPMPIPHRYRAVTGVLLLPLALAACSSGDAKNTTQPLITPAAARPPASPPSANASPSASAPAAKIGVPFRNGSFEITVTKVATGLQSLPITNEDDAAGITPPKPTNGQFVVVSIAAKNVSNKPDTCSVLNSRLIDSAGKTYTSDELFISRSLAADELQTASEQQPDTTRNGLIIFDVPTTLGAPTTLIMQSDAFVGTTNPPTPVSLLG